MNTPDYFPQYTAMLDETPQDGIPHHPPILVNININPHSAELIIADSDTLIAVAFEMFDGTLNNVLWLDPNRDECTRLAPITSNLEQLVSTIRSPLADDQPAPAYLQVIPVTLSSRNEDMKVLYRPVNLECRIETDRVTLMVLDSHDLIYTTLSLSEGILSVTSSRIVDGLQNTHTDVLTHNLAEFMKLSDDETDADGEPFDNIMPANDGQPIFVTLTIDNTPQHRQYEMVTHVVHIQAVTSGTILTSVHKNTIAESITAAQRLIESTPGYRLLDAGLAAWLSNTWDNKTRLSNAQLTDVFKKINPQTPAQAIRVLEPLITPHRAPSIYR